MIRRVTGCRQEHTKQRKDSVRVDLLQRSKFKVHTVPRRVW